MIRAGLEPYLPQLEYREWERCGHSPWVEKFVRAEFFAVLREWLARHLTGDVCVLDTLRRMKPNKPDAGEGK